jgi:hypothetical protein
MKEPCIEVFLNGKPLAQARMASGQGVIAQHVTWSKRKGEKKGDTILMLGGLDSKAGQHMDWIKPLELQMGDEVTIRLTNSRKATRPAKRKVSSKKLVLQQKINYFNRLKEELKGHI